MADKLFVKSYEHLKNVACKLLVSDGKYITLDVLYTFFVDVFNHTTERKWKLFIIILIDKCRQHGWITAGNEIAPTFEEAVEVAYAEGCMNRMLPDFPQ